MIEDKRYAEATFLADQVKQWLSKSRGPETFLKGDFPPYVSQEQKNRYLQELDSDWEIAKGWLAKLEPYRRAIRGISDLRKQVLERRDALLREIKKRQADRLSSAEQHFFGKDVEDLERMASPRFGKKFAASRRPASRVPEHLQEDQF